MIRVLVCLFFILFSLQTIAQNGPGGVGNSSGSNGQPRNAVWLDAAIGAQNGSSNPAANGEDVETWIDRSGNAISFTQSQGTNPAPPGFPQYTASAVNGFPALLFVRSEADRLVNNPFNNAPTSEWTTIVVFSLETNSDQATPISYAVPSDFNEYILIRQSGNFNTYVNSNQAVSSASIANSTGYRLLSSLWSSSDGNVDSYVEGFASGTPGSSTGNTSVGGALAIGGEQDEVDDIYNENQNFDGHIAEMLVYGTKLNSAQRILVENYLMEKYGLGAHPTDIYSNASGYIIDIGGIGRVDVSNQHTEGGSAGFYLQPSGSFGDGEYIMVGHAGGGTSTSTSDLPGGVVERWERDWYLDKTGPLSTNAFVEFEFREGVDGGQFPQGTSYNLLYRNTTSGSYSDVTVTSVTNTGARLRFELTDAQLLDGYYTIGTSDNANSPILGGPAKTWYSYQTGDYDQPTTWTLDGSSIPDFDNPGNDIPAAIDNIVITESKVVTIPNLYNVTVQDVEVIGTFDLQGSTGHSVNSISGIGRIRFSGNPTINPTDNFLPGDASAFATTGTVEVYGSGITLDQVRSFNNVQINLSSDTDEAVLTANYQVNGDLEVLNGVLRVNDASANNLVIDLFGNFSVSSGGELNVGTGGRHQMNFYGNFINEGETYFTTRTTTDFTNDDTNGVIDANFLNTSVDQSVQCNGLCRFYRIEIDKAALSDASATYILDINANNASNFELFGFANEGHGAISQLTDNQNAFGIISGTVRLNQNISVPRLNGAGNYNVSERARIWLNGGTVTKDQNEAVVIYGDVRVSDGIFNANIRSGFTIRDNGKLFIEGGLVNTNQIRTSVLGPSNVGGFEQSGGTLVIDGNGNGLGTNGSYAMFSLTYPNNVFTMSGGVMRFENRSGDYIFNNSDSYNVTGGTIIIDIPSNGGRIATKSPFFNMVIRKTSTSATGMEVSVEGFSSGGETVDEDLLYILNDLILESAAGGFPTQLDPVDSEIRIGGNFVIGTGANYQSPSNEGSGTNLTSFVDPDESYIDLDNNPSTVTIDRLQIAKATGDTLTVLNSGAATALSINRDLNVSSGVFAYGDENVEVFGDLIVNTSIEGNNSGNQLILNGSSTQNIFSSNGRVERLEIDNSNGVILQTGLLRIDHNLILTDGVFDINNQELYIFRDLESESRTDYNNSRMIQTSGNSSDPGLRRRNRRNVETLLYPVGVAGKYTPVVASFDRQGSGDGGDVLVSPVNNVLSLLNNPSADVLNYYWVVEEINYVTRPLVQFDMYYDNADVNGTETSFVPGTVDSNLIRLEDSGGSVDDVNDVINFSSFAVFDGSYTAGIASQFTGTIRKVYARKEGVWHDPDTWSSSPTGLPAFTLPSELPGSGDVVIVGTVDDNWSVAVDPSNPNYGPIDIAQLVILRYASGESSLVTFGDDEADRILHNLGLVTNRDPDISNPSSTSNQSTKLKFCGPGLPQGDFGEFVTAPNTIWAYSRSFPGTVDNIDGDTPRTFDGFTISNAVTEYPNLQFDASGISGPGSNDFIILPAADIVVNSDVRFFINENHIKFNSSAAGGDVLVKDDFVFNSDNVLVEFQASGSPRTLTIEDNLNFSSQNNGVIQVEASAGTTVHKIILNGDITNVTAGQSEINLFSNSANSSADFEFQGENDSSFPEMTTIPSFNKLIINKGSDRTNTVTMNSNFTLGAPTNVDEKALVLQNGSLVLDNASINIDLVTGGGSTDSERQFSIPGTTSLTLTNGTLNVSGDDTGILLDGELRINGGTVNMDDGVNNGNNYIEYTTSGNAELVIESGNLTVGSQIRRNLLSGDGILNYNQTGGTVIVGKNAAPESTRGVFEILNSGSDFNFSGGDLTVVRQNGVTPGIAAVYIDPGSGSASGSTLTIGNSDTPAVPAQNDIGIYSSIPLGNVTINGDNNPTAKISVFQPLQVENLNIAANNTFDANALDLEISGDLTVDGTFTPNGNETTFNLSSGTQTISGSGTISFFDLTKIETSTLELSSNTTVANDIILSSSATINTQIFDLEVQGDAEIDGTITSTSGNGINFNGSSQQQLTRSSASGTSNFDIISINNSNGVKVPEGTGYQLQVNNELKLDGGFLDLGGSDLLFNNDADITTTASFGTSNMIFTNSGASDVGVRKIFDSGTTDASLSDNTFVFPVGRAGVYTPFTIDISASGTMGTTQSSYLIRPVNNVHPTILGPGGDDTRVLQYYWTLNTTGINDFIGDIIFNYDQTDVFGTESAYVDARIRSENNGSGDIDKNAGSVDDGTNTITLSFLSATDNDQISADYFAGEPDAIPDNLTTYTVLAGNQDFTDPNAYTPVAPIGGPRGAIVVIPSGANLTLDQNGARLYSMEIQSGGTLTVGTTNQHNLREILGSGLVVTETTTLPAGSYNFTCSGLGIEYAGSSDIGILSGISTIRELVLSGTGLRSFAKDMIICEDLTVNGPTLDIQGNFNIQVDNNFTLLAGSVTSGNSTNYTITNELSLSGGTFNSGNNSSISLSGDLSRTSGSFVSSTGTIILEGASAQTISGGFTGVNSIYNLELRKTGSGVSIIDASNNDVLIDGSLLFNDGNITTDADHSLTLAAAATYSGASVNSHMNGPIIKESISAGSDFVFPTGKSGRYSPVIIRSVGTSNQDWTAEYFSTNLNDPLSFDATDSGYGELQEISGGDMWRVESSGSNSVNDVDIRYGSYNNVTDNSKLRVVEWSGTEWLNRGGTAIGDNTTGIVRSEVTPITFSSKDFSLGTTDDSALPIELLEFGAEVDNYTIKLQWSTAAEIENDFFTIERSTDAKEFESIGTLEGAGNSTELQKYSYVDDRPHTGVSYYRLKQTDFSGEYSYSAIVSVSISVFESSIKVSTYPNPFTDTFNLEFEGGKSNESLNLVIRDSRGRRINVEEYKADDFGNLNISINSLSSQKSGIYILTIISENGNISSKVLKER